MTPTWWVGLPTGQTTHPYYVAHVKITADALRHAGDLTLQAGMPAEVFVKTAARTPLQHCSIRSPATSGAPCASRELAFANVAKLIPNRWAKRLASKVYSLKFARSEEANEAN